MNAFRNRRGSALLIVLGMLAFMVVSAVAFSAFMRTSRLPSSYLRRVVSSKLLVKGALAAAIDEVDAAVGNFPHPGVWNNRSNINAPENIGSDVGSRMSENTPKYDDRDFYNYNTWLGRVYIGGNTVRSPQYVQDLLLPQYKTVSTLCLEALAYLPPPLVNEARYYSRHSRAGTWHTMGFDAGRYAFCAVDVSDHFDINALTAGLGRGSKSENRISLSYLFEDVGHQSAASGSSGWDSFIQGYIDQGVPLISLADWNLALGSKNFGSGIKSYFYTFATSGGAGSFYGGDGQTEESIDAIQRMAFVTDAWFPEYPGLKTKAEEKESEFDLTKEENQPFSPSDLKSGTHTLSGVRNLMTPPIKKLKESLCMYGLFALWDYLDADCVPLSLAVPTVERTPMIAAINFGGPIASAAQLKVNSSVQTHEEDNPYVAGQTKNGDPCHVKEVYRYEIEGIPDGFLKTVLVYPFRNVPDGAPDSFQVSGRLTYFLTIDNNTESVGLRTRNTGDNLRLTKQLNDESGIGNKGDLVRNAVLIKPLRDTDVSLSKFKVASSGQAGAVADIELQPKGQMPQSVPFLEVTCEWDTVHKVDTENETYLGLDRKTPLLNPNEVKGATCFFRPLDNEGNARQNFDAGLLAALLNGDLNNSKLRLNVAVSAWIKDTTSGKLVDLVPASVADDAVINDRNTDSMSRQFDSKFLGGAGPVMKFPLSANTAVLEVNASSQQFQSSPPAIVSAVSGVNVQVSPVAAMCADPRYNHAPESWFTQTTEISAAKWLENCHCSDVGRDGDIFMQTSDQCYLQSIYELANLPRLTGFYEGGDSGKGREWDDYGWYENPDAAWSEKDLPDAFERTVNNAYMWRTYNPFPGDYPNGTGAFRTEGDDFENAGFTSAGTGFKVNPYSDNTNVVMAAFANTPLEWAYAADSERSGVSRNWSGKDDAAFNRDYAWNAYGKSDKPHVHWFGDENNAGLADVAGTFMHEMRVNNGGDWRDAFASLRWYDTQVPRADAAKYLLGDYWDDETGDYVRREMRGASSHEYKIYNCDRKFLYGFWHDCFGVKQQLYLIFVRAEPMLMGGGAIHQSPPALGTRAVALVWRDPVDRCRNPQPNDYSSKVQPHRTRVLFYRQFD